MSTQSEVQVAQERFEAALLLKSIADLNSCLVIPFGLDEKTVDSNPVIDAAKLLVEHHRQELNRHLGKTSDTAAAAPATSSSETPKGSLLPEPVMVPAQPPVEKKSLPLGTKAVGRVKQNMGEGGFVFLEVVKVLEADDASVPDDVRDVFLHITALPDGTRNADVQKGMYIVFEVGEGRQKNQRAAKDADFYESDVAENETDELA